MMPRGVLLILGTRSDFMASHASIKMGTLCDTIVGNTASCVFFKLNVDIKV